MAVEVKEKEHSDVETEQLATGCEAIAEAITSPTWTLWRRIPSAHTTA